METITYGAPAAHVFKFKDKPEQRRGYRGFSMLRMHIEYS